TMTSPVFALFLTCLFLRIMAQTTDLKSSTVRQETRFLSVKTGEELTLQCFYEGDVAVMLYWYKQTLGQKPKLISTYHEYNINGIFHDEFKNNSRFTLDMENGKNHLKITDVRVSDSATYYCASSDTYTYIFEFAEGTVVDSPFLVYFLSAALAFTTILSVLLAFLMYKVNKRNSCQTAVNHATFPSPSTASAEGYQDADNLHYAALSVNLPNRSRRQRNNTNNECVYSSVKQ
uniref:Ig-like domain-containing protein n=1 Tax=Sander lucioperca TaxID=283035 RepID=A0A8C9YS39_SANLU